MATSAASLVRHRDRRFNLLVAIAVAALVFAGFARSYYLRGYFFPLSLTPMLHLHGLIFSCWFLMLMVQVGLVYAGRTDLHRRVGVAGWVLAGMMIPLGLYTGIHAGKYGSPSFPPEVPRLVFLVVPLADIAVFTVFVAGAFLYRRRPPIHKRMIFLASIGILAPAVARLPVAFIQRGGPPIFFGIVDLVLLICIGYDWSTTKRLHPVYLWGGLFLIMMQPLRMVIGGTAAWMRFAQTVTGWV